MQDIAFYKHADKVVNLFKRFSIQFSILTSDDFEHIVHKVPSINQVIQTGISVFQEECLYYKGDSILLVPIKETGRVEAIGILQPKDGNKEWFVQNREMLGNLAEVGCHLLSCESIAEKLEKENDLLKREVLELFSMTDDLFLMISYDGRIEEINHRLAEKLNARKHILIGEEVTSIISEKSWFDIKESKNMVIHRLEMHKSILNKQEFIAHVKPIFNKEQVQSYLIKLELVKPSPKKMEKKIMCCFEDIKGTSAKLQEVITIAKRVSTSDVTILLRGESGTGKEIFAQSIHKESSRSDKPFVALNCAAIPENLLESELFGHVKGSFTGAVTDKPGRFELANGGTIFLDEIGDMSLHLQAKLLRVVQERKIERVGDSNSKNVDVRIITATHQNLEQLVREGNFREDLFYRLNVIPLFLPSLRDRKDDIPILIEHFMKKFSMELNRPPKRLSADVYRTLLNHQWPGNIREIQNVVQHFF
ncbi:sigma-54-dependent Fis family transcriptional regulator [Bacillus sp. FJAT-29814]|uniref:sigma-54 interaction domain-containing protein n=1 Tax=Bacillus sp. FJAT-29814 TaxID=1729688 RepID=UPI00082CC349|nr:sigma 54-interacting transcriptional regulator [Bacillus sp. FJAT-29814]